MNTFENYTFVILGKKENDRFFDLLQEKIKYGDGKIDFIYNETLAKQCEQFYKNKGFITKIEKIKPLSNVNFKKEFNY